MRRLFLLGMLLPAACAARRSLDLPADIDPSGIESHLWQQDWAGAERAAEAVGWRAAGSVEGERYRQGLQLRRGRRAALMRATERWLAEDPGNPSIEYLQARLLQQPESQYQVFQRLARRHPRHAWIRLGAAGTAQSRGRWSRAARQLAGAPDWPDARDFHRILTARQLFQEEGVEAALETLEEAAFLEDRRAALEEYEALAAAGGAGKAVARARSHAALLALPAGAPASLRMERVAARALAEIAAGAAGDLDSLLADLDRWSARAGLPAGWAGHPRYKVPLVGALVRPEGSSGGPPAAWQAEGQMLLLGESILRGVEMAWLRGVRIARLPWRGSPEPVEVVLAGSARTSHTEHVVGGAVFRGFYLREDLATAVAEGVKRALAPLELPVPFQAPAYSGEPGSPPEDWDLPLRMRAELADHADPVLLELRHVALHEAGHLPEVLVSIPDGPPFRLAASLLMTALWTGEPLAPLEYRAEARALAAAPQPHWVLAEVVEQARGGQETYHRAYRWLLDDLLAAASARELPPLPLWDSLPAETLRALAAEVCRKRRFEPMAASEVASVLRAVEAMAASGLPGRSRGG